MLVIGSVSWDLNWFRQFIITALVIIVVGLFTWMKNNASRYFDANFEGDHHHHSSSSSSASMPSAVNSVDPICAVCSSHATKRCSRCKTVRYCSAVCQQLHWKSGHEADCKNLRSVNSAQNGATNGGFKASAAGGKGSNLIALVPGGCGKSSRQIKLPKDVLFPYDEFVKLFNWDKPGFHPCGLLNCGNSCFANVVLQCLSFTRPLVAYLLEKGHRKECNCNDWCFLCEFENHVERTRLSSQAFSPMNILSRLPNIGGTLGYGRQEDAHEFMRFSIDTMQSVCLNEFGGEKVVPSNLQETTIIQHIFGGRLQSEVICTKCEKTSNQYESMMDLTVEIHGDAASLEECLDQFTVKEWLDGENMYKCEGCQDYVKAWKRLTVKCAPNILTIALKRFQSGRFGKLNKRVAFPETLNLSPYMSEAGDGSDMYKLYAVVVHIDMLNASFFGHYICYIKDFQGNWYRIDDSKVASVELEEVLSQGAYMLLYRRCSARPSCLQIQTTESSGTEERTVEVESSGTVEERTVEVEVEPYQTEQAESLSNIKALTCSSDCEVSPHDISPELKVSSSYEYESSIELNSEANKEQSEDTSMIDVESTDIANNISSSAVESSYLPISYAVNNLVEVDMERPIEETSGCAQDQDDTGMTGCMQCLHEECGFCANSKSEFLPGACLAGEKIVKGMCREQKRVWFSQGCPSKIGFLAVVILGVYIIAYAPGIGTVPWVLNSEIYPLRFRGLGGGIAAVFNWCANLIVSQSFLSMIKALGTSGTFLLFAGFSVIGFFAIYLLVPETKGLQFEEVEKLLQKGFRPFPFNSKKDEDVKGKGKGKEEMNDLP